MNQSSSNSNQPLQSNDNNLNSIQARKRLPSNTNEDASPEIEFRAFLRSKSNTNSNNFASSTNSNFSNNYNSTSTSTGNASSYYSRPINNGGNNNNNNNRLLKKELNGVNHIEFKIGANNNNFTNSNNNLNNSSPLNSPALSYQSNETGSTSNLNKLLPQKIKRKPSPKEISINPVNLDLIYQNSPSNSLPSPSSSSKNVERPFLSAGMETIKVRESNFILDREVPTSGLNLISTTSTTSTTPSSPLNSPSLSRHHQNDSITSSNEVNLNRTRSTSSKNDNNDISKRDSIMESSFTRMQAMFEDQLSSQQEVTEVEEVNKAVEVDENQEIEAEEVEERDTEKNEVSIADVMLAEGQLDELLDGIDSSIGGSETSDDDSFMGEDSPILDEEVEFLPQLQDVIISPSLSPEPEPSIDVTTKNVSPISTPTLTKSVQFNLESSEYFLPTPDASPTSKPQSNPLDSIPIPIVASNSESDSDEPIFSSPTSPSNFDHQFNSPPMVQIELESQYQYQPEHRGSVSSSRSDDSSVVGPLTPTFVDVKPLAISSRKNLSPIMNSSNSLDSNSQPTINVNRSSRGPPPPRPKRLRLPVSASTTQANLPSTSTSVVSIVPELPTDVQTIRRDSVQSCTKSENDLDSNNSNPSSSGVETMRRSNSNTIYPTNYIPRSPSPFSHTRRTSSLSSLPASPPPLYPLPATPVKASSYQLNRTQTSSPSPSPNSQNNFRQSITNPYETNYDAPMIRVRSSNSNSNNGSSRMSAASPALSDSSSYSWDDTDKTTKDPESFFYRPPPPKQQISSSSTINQNSTNSSERLEENKLDSNSSEIGLGLGLNLPAQSNDSSELKVISNKELEDSKFESLFSELSTPLVEEHEQEEEEVEEIKGEVEPETSISTSEERSNSPDSTDSTSISSKVLSNVSEAVVYGSILVGTGALKGLTTAVKLGNWGWNTLSNLESPTLSQSTWSEGEDGSESEGEVMTWRKLSLPGSFDNRCFSPILEIEDKEEIKNQEEFEVDAVVEEEEKESDDINLQFKNYSFSSSKSAASARMSNKNEELAPEDLIREEENELSSNTTSYSSAYSSANNRMQQESNSNASVTRQLSTSVSTIRSQSQSHSRTSSNSTSESHRTITTTTTNRLPAPTFSPDSYYTSTSPKYFAPPGLAPATVSPPPSYTSPSPPISTTQLNQSQRSNSSNSSSKGRPVSIAASSVSDKSIKGKSSRSFFSFGKSSSSKNKEVEPPLPPLPPLPPIPNSISSSEFKNSISKISGGKDYNSRNKLTTVEADIGNATYVNYSTGRANRRNSITTTATSISPKRNNDLSSSTSSSSSRAFPTISSSTPKQLKSILRKESSFDRTRLRSVSITSNDSSTGSTEGEKSLYSVRFANATKGLGLRSVAEIDSQNTDNHPMNWIGVGNGRYGNLTMIQDERTDEYYAEQVRNIRGKWRGFGSETVWSNVRIE